MKIFYGLLAFVGALTLISGAKQPTQKEVPQASTPTTTSRAVQNTVSITPSPTATPTILATPSPSPTPTPTASVKVSTATPKPQNTSTPKPVTQTTSQQCDSNYTPCVPYVSYDLNCPDIGFRVSVIGTDRHKLDNDKDGIGCESYR
jgi:hypothetical protein